MKINGITHYLWRAVDQPATSWFWRHGENRS